MAKAGEVGDGREVKVRRRLVEFSVKVAAHIARRDLCHRGRIERLGYSGRAQVGVGEREDQRVGNLVQARFNTVGPELLCRALDPDPPSPAKHVTTTAIVLATLY